MSLKKPYTCRCSINLQVHSPEEQPSLVVGAKVVTDEYVFKHKRLSRSVPLFSLARTDSDRLFLFP